MGKIKIKLRDQIRQVDLISVVESAGVDLRRSGNRHVGLCPLHSDSTPSFYIFDDHTWWCFGGCGGGDAVDLVQMLYGCSFKEALTHLGINGRRLSSGERWKIQEKKKRTEARIERERDIIFTLAVLIRAAGKCSYYVGLLPAWEWYFDVIINGTKEEKLAIIDGLKDWPVVSRNYLFRPDFNYKAWLQEFLNGVPKNEFKINLHFKRAEGHSPKTSAS